MRPLPQILQDSTADRVAAEGATGGEWFVSTRHPDRVVHRHEHGGDDYSVANTHDSDSEIDAANIARNASPTRVAQRAADIEGMADLLARMADELREAISYTPEYFRDKHGIGEVLAEYDAAVKP